MHAYRLNGESGPLQHVTEPDPIAGYGQVLIELKAATLNYRDLIIREDWNSSVQQANLIPLSDGAGVIKEVGHGVSPDRIGERVAIGFMPDWVEGPFNAEKQASALGGGFINGVLAERIVVSASSVVKIPDSWSFVDGAAYPCAGVTAWNCLFGGNGIRPGDTVLVEGTGGVSTFALQFAHSMGARVIATSSSDAKLAQAKALGADEGINYRTTPDWGARAAEIAGNGGVDQIVEVGGPETLNQALQAVRPGGEIALVGVLTGFGGEVNTGAILTKAINLRGVYVGSVNDLAASIRTGIVPIIDEVYSFDDVDSAFERLRSGNHRGKVAIKIAD